MFSRFFNYLLFNMPMSRWDNLDIKVQYHRYAISVSYLYLYHVWVA